MGMPEVWSPSLPTTSDTERVLLIKLILAETGGGGGGGGVQQVFPGHYGGVPPVFTPPAAYAMAPDLDPPNQTFFWNPDTSLWE